MIPTDTLPELVRAVVRCNQCALSGLFVQARIATSFKNDFYSLHGPADEAGVIAFSRDDLLREGNNDRNLFLMDYGHPESDYSGYLEVRPMGRESLRRALEAYELFKDVVTFPPDYAKQLEHARRILDELAPAHLDVQLEVSRGTGKVVGFAAEA
jgi:hypothetical protein